MPKPGEHKTVQARILQYAQDIGWKFIFRAEAEQRRGIVGGMDHPAYMMSLFFDNLLYQKISEFNPFYAETPGALVGRLRRLSANIYGNRDMLTWLRNNGKFFHAEENRERDLMLIDYVDPSRNVYEVTEEFVGGMVHPAYNNREDVVFLINGIPVLVGECKNADKDEGIALGMDNVEHAHSIARINQLLKSDVRGIIVSTIHKFRDMPANLNQRRNLYVLVDEAHRTTEKQMGILLNQWQSQFQHRIAGF